MSHVLTTVEDSDDEIPMLFEDSHRHAISDDYEILQELGIGKFSVVRMAQHKVSRAKVAIKQIDRRVCPAELLVKEVNIMAKLKGCSGVIHLIEVYEEPTKPYTHLVMELVTGGELFDYIVKSSSYSEKSASDYIRQLCQTVEYLHSKNIVHRDLKPENMLFEDPSAQVLKLCDFGLADTLKDDFDFLTLAVGTKSYMAPEVSSGMGYGKPVDMYSIGVILYILLCGYLPIDPENGIYVLEFPPSEWSGISFEVKLLIKKLLDDSPAARPTATQVLKHPWIKGTNTSTKPLVGTVRNLKSWNQVGGRAITKPRAQVMNLFDNPPPAASPSSTEASPSATQSSPKAKRAASPKPKVTKSKKAALPKLIDGTLTTPTANADAGATAQVVAASPSKGKSKGTKEEGAKKSKTPQPSPEITHAPTPPANLIETSSSSSKSTNETGDSKPKRTKRKTDRAGQEHGRSPSKTGSKAAHSPTVKATDTPIAPTNAKTETSNSTASSAAAVATSPASKTSTSRHERSATSNGEKKPTKPVSDRTKQFLKEQDEREAAKKSESTEKKRRRKSAGGAAMRSDKLIDEQPVNAPIEPSKSAEKASKPEKTKDKKDKNGEKKDKSEKREKDASAAAGAIVTSKSSKTIASNTMNGSKGEATTERSPVARATKRKSMKEIPADDLSALIESALSDDEESGRRRRRSSSVAGISPPPKPRRNRSKETDLVSGGSASSSPSADMNGTKPSKKPGRDRSATSHDAKMGDFSAFGSGAPTAPTSSGNGSKLKIVTATRTKKNDSDGSEPVTLEEHYPRRSASKSSGLASKKAARLSAGPANPSPKKNSGSSRPSTPPLDENGEKVPVVSRASSRRATSPKAPRSSTSKDKLNIKSSPKGKRREDSDSESYGTGQSSPATPVDDNLKVLLDTPSSYHTEDAPTQTKKKKIVPMKQLSSLSSGSE